MGRHVADYTVVRDRNFTVNVNEGDELRMNFKLRRGGLRSRLKSILTFVIRDAQGLRLRVDINNNPVLEENIANGNFERTIQQIFPVNVFDRSDNEITFTAVRGRGTFSDLVLWYRRPS